MMHREHLSIEANLQLKSQSADKTCRPWPWGTTHLGALADGRQLTGVRRLVEVGGHVQALAGQRHLRGSGCMMVPTSRLARYFWRRSGGS